MIEEQIEIEGRVYVCGKRLVQEDPHGEWQTEYTFDSGDTWRCTLIEAFQAAQAAGKLVCAHAAPRQSEGFEAFVVALLAELKALSPGESLKVYRSDAEFVVTKEEAVLVTRASTLRDVDVRLEEKDAEGGQG